MYTIFVESRTIHEFSTCISTQTLPMPYFSLLIRDVLHMDFFQKFLVRTRILLISEKLLKRIGPMKTHHSYALIHFLFEK